MDAYRLAMELTWRTPDLRVLRPDMEEVYSVLARSLQEHLLHGDARGSLLLPDLRALGNQAVGVYSDYSGEGSGRFDTYSVLVCALHIATTFTDGPTPFAERMRQVRAGSGLKHMEIAFKKRKKGQMQRALPGYLGALDCSVPGYLFTLAVDKRIATLFASPETPDREALQALLTKEGLGDWDRHTAEKLLRVVHLSAFLTALLAHDGQKIFWMSDKDNREHAKLWGLIRLPLP